MRLLLLGMLLSAGLLRVSAGVGTAPVTVSVIGTNDLHGAVRAEDGRGGLPLLAGYISNLRQIREADGGAVLLVDAGDMFQGTLESNLNEGAVVVDAYNAMGYAAAAIGNHEFDFGPEGPGATPGGSADDRRGALKARAASARFPFLAANIIDTSTGQAVRWPNVQSSTLVTVAGVRIGIVGVATEATLTSTASANTVGLEMAPLAATLATEAERLRRAGATVVVAAAHAGGRCAEFTGTSDLSSCASDEEIFRAARTLPAGSIDVIVAGHRHYGIAHDVSGVAVISSFSRGRAFGRVDLSIDRATGRVEARDIHPPRDVCASVVAGSGRCAEPGLDLPSVPASYEGRPVTPSAAIAAILAPAVARADAVKVAPLGSSVDQRLERDGDGESALGNLLADWTLAVTAGADLAVVNGGGLRAALPSGPLTYGRLFEVTPFDNRQVVMTLRGADVARAIAGHLQRPGGALLVSGITAAARCAGPRLVVTVRQSNGRVVRDDDILKVATSDFLATGGDGFFAGIQPIAVTGADSGPVLREEIAAWLGHAKRQWRAQDLFDPSRPRIAYSGSRPLSCR